MAVLYPPAFPHDLAQRPARAGEKVVYDALARALDDDWSVFYDRRVKGSNRPIDFIVLHPERGLVAIEVKGGMVHAMRGKFRQALPSTTYRKAVLPFAQLKKAIAALFAATGVTADEVPCHLAVFLPLMSAKAFIWGTSPHLLTREHIEPDALRSFISTALTGHVDDRGYAALSSLALQLAAGERQ